MDIHTLASGPSAGPRKWRKHLLLSAASALVLSASAPAWAVPSGDPDDYTTIGSSSEPALADILADTGYDLTRVPDTHDGLWEVISSDARVRARARHSGGANVFGVVALGGPAAGVFQPLISPREPIHWESDEEPWDDVLGSLFAPGEQFLLAIQTSTELLTSRPEDNVDLLDHMVTWVNDDDPYHYFVGFEDIPGGGDLDFNDLVIELQLVLDGPAMLSEPSSLALAGLSLAGLAGLRRRRRTR